MQPIKLGLVTEEVVDGRPMEKLHMTEAGKKSVGG
jgi:hypothetical protein